jgi:hypothetical protein
MTSLQIPHIAALNRCVFGKLFLGPAFRPSQRFDSLSQCTQGLSLGHRRPLGSQPLSLYLGDGAPESSEIGKCCHIFYYTQ